MILSGFNKQHYYHTLFTQHLQMSKGVAPFKFSFRSLMGSVFKMIFMNKVVEDRDLGEETWPLLNLERVDNETLVNFMRG